MRKRDATQTNRNPESTTNNFAATWFGRAIEDLVRAHNLLIEANPRAETEVKRLIGNARFIVCGWEVGMVNHMRERDLGEGAYDVLRFLGYLRDRLDEALILREPEILAEVANLLAIYCEDFFGQGQAAITAAELN
jgi:hypothetical protein